jgi:transposase
LKDFKTWLDIQAMAVLPKSALGEAVGYTLRHWDALSRYTEAGYLEASNNFAERCMRTVAAGRKAFLFVGSERAGHAAAIYYSIVQSCKVNHVNPVDLSDVCAQKRSQSGGDAAHAGRLHDARRGLGIRAAKVL